MKKIAFIFYLLCSIPLFAQETDFRKVPAELESVWNEFAMALKENDAQKIQALSLTCIECLVCDDEESDGKTIFSIEQFMRDYYTTVFSRTVRERAQDATKLFFVTHDKIRKKNLNACFRPFIRAKKSKHIEVLITVNDPDGKFEGAQYGLNFIQTKMGFRLYAIYSIP